MQKKFCESKFHHHENDMEFLMIFYTINHSHYHHLVPLTKQIVSENTGQLFTYANIRSFKSTIKNFITYQMAIHLNMCSSSLRYRIRNNMQSCLNVAIEFYWLKMRNVKTIKHLAISTHMRYIEIFTSNKIFRYTTYM